MTREQRFWAKVLIGDGCWLWTGAKRKGYGLFGEAGKGVTRQAHTIAYNILEGPSPLGLEPDHLCRDHSCIRPDHLEWITHRENVLRGEGMAAHRARQTHCTRGHELTLENTRMFRGTRRCRECSRHRGILCGCYRVPPDAQWESKRSRPQ